MKKRLYRDTRNKKLLGVCAGLAKYFDIDPTIVRLVFVLLSLGVFSGILVYIVCALIMPEEPVDYIDAN